MKKSAISIALGVIGAMLMQNLVFAQDIKIHEDYTFSSGELPYFQSTGQGGMKSMQKRAIAKIYARDEYFTSFHTPAYSNNPDIVYLSTQKVLKEGLKWQNKIYSYNLKTGKLKLLYKERMDRLLRTVGMEGSKLIIMLDGIDNSPGPCFSFWADWEDFGYIDVSRARSKIMPYIIPQYKIDEAKAGQEECIAETFGE